MFIEYAMPSLRLIYQGTRLLACLLLLLATGQTTTLYAQPEAGVRFAKSQGNLKRILNQGRLRVGLQRDFHPYHIEQARAGYPGIDVEVARLIADYFDVKLEFVYGDLPQLLTGVQSGRMDIALGGVSSNLKRSRYVYFSLPYITTTAGALIRRRSLPRESQSIEFSRKQYRRLPDLNQAGVLLLGALQGTSNLTLLKQDPNFKKHKVRAYSNRKTLMAALRAGEIDALVADAIYIKSLLLKDPGLESRFVAVIQSYRPEHVSIVLPRGDLHFFFEIQFVIKELQRDGRLDRIRHRYLQNGDWLPKNNS